MQCWCWQTSTTLPEERQVTKIRRRPLCGIERNSIAQMPDGGGRIAGCQRSDA
jgi:hypothetical protein